MYALADCQWLLSNPVENKQWIKTLVSNAANPYLKIKHTRNVLLTVCRDAIAQWYRKYDFKRYLGNDAFHPITSARRTPGETRRK